jgi:hypothetical protein
LTSMRELFHLETLPSFFSVFSVSMNSLAEDKGKLSLSIDDEKILPQCLRRL